MVASSGDREPEVGLHSSALSQTIQNVLNDTTIGRQRFDHCGALYIRAQFPLNVPVASCTYRVRWLDSLLIECFERLNKLCYKLAKKQPEGDLTEIH
jgi:hypothetical protein